MPRRARTHAQCIAGGSKVNCTSRSLPEASEPGYAQPWYDRIAADGEKAEHYAVPAGLDLETDALTQAKLRVLNKEPWQG